MSAAWPHPSIVQISDRELCTINFFLRILYYSVASTIRQQDSNSQKKTERKRAGSSHISHIVVHLYILHQRFYHSIDKRRFVIMHRKKAISFHNVVMYAVIFLFLARSAFSSTSRSAKKRFKRFEFLGPVVTVTLREPLASSTARPTLTCKPTHALDLNDTVQDTDRYRTQFQRMFQHITSSSKRIRNWVAERADVDLPSEGWIPYSFLSSLSSLSPSLTWSIRSTSAPLPRIFPSLRSIAWTLVYQQNPANFITSTGDAIQRSNCPIPATMYTTSPLYLSTQARFSTRLFQFEDYSFLLPFSSYWRNRRARRRRNALANSAIPGTSNFVTPDTRTNRRYTGVPVSLEIVSIHHLDHQQKSLTIKIGLGESVPHDLNHDIPNMTTTNPMYNFDSHARFNVVAHLATSPSSSTNKNPSIVSSSSSSSTVRSSPSPLLRSLYGSYHLQRLPSFTSIQSLSIHPAYDFCTNTPTCMIKAKSSSGRTTALFDFNWDDPTFAIIHDLDEYNTISPEISLSTSSIIYNWKVQLENQGNICTRVDPMSCIDIVWTDPSGGGRSGGRDGKWITNIHLPLSLESRDTGYTGVGRFGSNHWKQAWKANIRVRRTFVF